MTDLRIWLLGPPRAELNDVPIDVDTRKAIAILAYLAVSAQPHRRDTLAALLWPESDHASARSALRRTLSTLRTALAGRWLAVDGETVRLGEGSWLDVRQFLDLLDVWRGHGHPMAEVCPECLAHLGEAADLYRGAFMAGFSLRDSPEFDDWQAAQSELMVRAFSSCLERLVAGHAALGAYDAAGRYALRWLSLDPLQEAAHQSLMRLHAWKGDRSAALRQYRECVRILDRELGVSPLEETTELRRAIAEGNVPPPDPPLDPRAETPRRVDAAAQLASDRPQHEDPSRGQVTAPSDLPMVGREKQWDVLRQVLETDRTRGHLVVIEGEAGIGKTRLVVEFLAYAQALGRRALLARCFEGESSLAYGPFVEVLRSAMLQPVSEQRLDALPALSVAEAARLQPDIARRRPDLPHVQSLDSPGAQTRFFSGVLDVLLDCSGEPAGGVFAIDDLHWADEASLDLFSFLTRRLDVWPVLLVATWRPENVTDGHRLHTLLANAQRSGDATLVSLTRLSPENIGELVQPLLASRPALPDDLATRLYSESDGLPLFLTEYLAAFAQDPPSPDAGTIPRGVRDLLLGRMSHVSEAARQLLAAAATLGRSFGFDLARHVSGRSADEALTALEELVSRRLVQEVQSAGPEQAPMYDFSHEQLRALVYEETSLARRRLLHRRTADALIRGRRGRTETGSRSGLIAHHLRLAGDERAAAHIFKQAGDFARSLYANAEASAHFQTALALGHPEAAALHEAIGDLRTLAGDYSEAIASYETAAAVSDARRLPILEHKLGSVCLRRGDWDLADRHFEAALGGFADDSKPGMCARVHVDLCLTAHRRGQVPHAQQLADEALRLAGIGDDDAALAQANNALGILARSRDDLDAADRHLRQSLELADRIDDIDARLAALNNLALVLVASGRYIEAQSLAEEALTLCARLGDRHREAAVRNNLADLHYQGGPSRRVDGPAQAGRWPLRRDRTACRRIPTGDLEAPGMVGRALSGRRPAPRPPAGTNRPADGRPLGS
ncbi:MAG: AAA family ATPase [Chloroflexi bacterium]|nr:AAA family ATPase [Chloroflexota bacterium]